jgi:hypothetical protein
MLSSRWGLVTDLHPPPAFPEPRAVTMTNSGRSFPTFDLAMDPEPETGLSYRLASFLIGHQTARHDEPSRG